MASDFEKRAFSQLDRVADQYKSLWNAIRNWKDVFIPLKLVAFWGLMCITAIVLFVGVLLTFLHNRMIFPYVKGRRLD